MFMKTGVGASPKRSDHAGMQATVAAKGLSLKGHSLVQSCFLA